ncbi:MAG: formylglycine-generating enzyme family protein [Planctomycetota bacterium]
MAVRCLISYGSLLLLLPGVLGCKTAPRSPPGKHRPERDYVEEIRGSKVRFRMRWIPGGGFWIGETEVTWDEYLLYCDFEETGRVPPGADAVSKPSKPQEDVSPFDRDWGTGRRPAVGMSWNAAKRYCQWLSLNTGRLYRLPTEREWALACEGAGRPLGDYAWYKDNSDYQTHEVGLKQPNVHGLHDMLGNLWEYCRDPYDASEPDLAVLRGGAWSTPASELGVGSRLRFDRDWVLDDPNEPPGVWWVPDGDHLGFRVLRPREGKKQ